MKIIRTLNHVPLYICSCLIVETHEVLQFHLLIRQ